MTDSSSEPASGLSSRPTPGPNRDARHQHREFVRARAEHEPVAGEARKALREVLQHAIARGKAERLVDRLEALDVERDERDPRRVAYRERLVETLVEEPAVRQARQDVVVREVVDPLLLLAALERERQVRRELGQQPHLGLVEHVALGGDDDERAFCPLADE